MTKRKKWPTVIIESGMSESLARLRQDSKRRFGSSNGDVKIVILINLDVQTQHIAIEVWKMSAGSGDVRLLERRQRPSRKGPLTFRSPLPSTDRPSLQGP